MPGTPGWVTERLGQTIPGRVVMHWTALVLIGGQWRVYVCQTDGEVTPHTAPAARKVINEINPGIARMAVCGPYYSREDANRIVTALCNDDDFSVNMAYSAF